MSSFWLKLNQQWTIEEISIFSISRHLEWRVELWDTILKGTNPGTIPARLGLIWFSGFRGEDLNVKVYDGRQTPSDDKSSHGLWPGELKMGMVPVSPLISLIWQTLQKIWWKASIYSTVQGTRVCRIREGVTS